MIRLFFISASILFYHAVLSQEKPFTIQGNLGPSSVKYKVLLSWNNGATAEEADVVNGKFLINGTIDAPVAAILNLEEAEPSAGKEYSRLEAEQNTLFLFLDSGTITISTTGFLWNAEVKGSKLVNEFQEYQLQIKNLYRLESKMGEVFDAYKKEKNDLAAAEVFKLYEKMLHLYYMEQLAFVKKKPGSPVSLYLCKLALGNNMDATKANPLFELLSPELKNSDAGKEIASIIEVGKKSMVGSEATDFVQPSTSGISISLSSFKGKYVLVDFWASWCGPCRAESPNLVKAYNQYKNRNFEILSVSLDEKKERWLKAIKEDGYTWTQVGDMKGWESPAARIYGINGIPFNFLVNPDGIIIARNLRGEELEQTLKDILK